MRECLALERLPPSLKGLLPDGSLSLCLLAVRKVLVLAFCLLAGFVSVLAFCLLAGFVSVLAFCLLAGNVSARKYSAICQPALPKDA